MALKVHSIFYYGHVVDSSNNKIAFKEGAGPELIAEIPAGSYTLTEYINKVSAALNAAGALDWTAVANRDNRLVTIAASGPASLLWSTGSTVPQSAATMLGFSTAADLLNQTIFTSTLPTGSAYSPQFPLQDYLPKARNKKLTNAVVTKSASGNRVNVQKFGSDVFIRCNIRWVTNEDVGGGLIRNNPAAVEELETFLSYIIEKNPVEFMEDENQRDAFDKVIIEATAKSPDGTGFELVEYVDKFLPEFFESGLLTFKVLE